MPLGNCSSGLSTPLWSRSSSLKRFVISSFLRTTTSTIQFHRRQRRRGCRGRDSPIFDLQGSSCVDDPQYLTSVLFFPFSGTSEYRKSLPFSSVMHHITPFRDEKFINFLGRGTAPPQTHPLAAYGASILASSALDLRPPMFPWRGRPCSILSL